MTQQPRVTGVLFAKSIPNGPVYAGKIMIDGVETHISIWEKTSKAGNNYLQISEDKRGGQSSQQGQRNFGGGAGQYQRPNTPPPVRPIGGYNQPTTGRHNSDMDDDIPF